MSIIRFYDGRNIDTAKLSTDEILEHWAWCADGCEEGQLLQAAIDSARREGSEERGQLKAENERMELALRETVATAGSRIGDMVEQGLKQLLDLVNQTTRAEAWKTAALLCASFGELHGSTSISAEDAQAALEAARKLEAENNSEPAVQERWCYSEHEEEFWAGDCETREDAIAAGRAEYECGRFFTGLAVSHDAADYAPSVDAVREEMHENACEDCISDILDGWPRENMEADRELNSLLEAWARKYHTPTWFGVSDVIEHAQEGGES